MSEEKSRKTYIVLSVIALAVLVASAAFISTNNIGVSTSSASDAVDTPDATDATGTKGADTPDTNDGKTVSDGDGETKDDSNDESK